MFLTNDLNGKRIVEKNGTYSLTPGASYSYTTTCAGYIGQTVEHYTAPRQGRYTDHYAKEGSSQRQAHQFRFCVAPTYAKTMRITVWWTTKTPVYAKDAELYWATSIDPAAMWNACGCPILVDGAIYTSGSRILQGGCYLRRNSHLMPMDHNSSFAINPPTYANGMIFVGLSDGTIQAVRQAGLPWIHRDPSASAQQLYCSSRWLHLHRLWVGEINEAPLCVPGTTRVTQTMEESSPTWYYTSQRAASIGPVYYVCDDFCRSNGTDDGASGHTTGKPSLLSFNLRPANCCPPTR